MGTQIVVSLSNRIMISLVHAKQIPGVPGGRNGIVLDFSLPDLLFAEEGWRLYCAREH